MVDANSKRRTDNETRSVSVQYKMQFVIMIHWDKNCWDLDAINE